MDDLVRAAQAYIEALEEELGHQGVGGGQEMKALRQAWEKERTRRANTLMTPLGRDMVEFPGEKSKPAV